MLVSVVIPTFNRSHLIERAVRSVLGQTHSELEVIVVDDASNDDTQTRVLSLGGEDNRVRYLRHDANKGSQAARNTGIMQARGELVGFLDSDNEWLPYKLELQLRLFAKSPPDLGVVYGGYRQVFWDGRPPTFVAPRHRGNIFEQALKEWIADTNTMLIRKDVLVRVGMWDTRVSAYQEWDMCIRLAKQVAFDFVDQPLAVYHVHEGDTISKNLKLSAQGRLDIAEIHREDILRRCGKQVLSQHFLNAGHEFVCASDFQTARLCFKKALKACPTSLRVWKHLIPSQFGEQVYLASMKLKQSLRQGRSAPVKC